jgi:diaminopropionate ammonia-lyase
MKTVERVNRAERLFENPDAGAFVSEPPSRAPLEFHRRLPGYAPSRLIEAPQTAERLGLAKLWVKDESNRLGLPAFKILGASWATIQAARRALRERTGADVGEWQTLDDLATQLAPLRPMTLACATDGNHGRAVARMARWLGFDARIFVPSEMAAARKQAIASEGATVIEIDGSYDEAIARSAEEANERCLVISDTSWPGYEDVPRWVIEGYSTILWEIDDELARRGEAGPDLVAVQIGVGAFAAAVVGHYRRPGVAPRPVILGAEPNRAACAMASLEAGEIVEVPPPHDSIMAGLNCGLVSRLAWPVVSGGIDAFIAIEDERARSAMRALAAEGIVAGECGAAGLAGLTTWQASFGGDLRGKRALIISTEGATDPEAYSRIVG